MNFFFIFVQEGQEPQGTKAVTHLDDNCLSVAGNVFPIISRGVRVALQYR
jgi:hypothetical protein